MWTLPLLAVLTMALFWAYSGRYIATDNAYVKATQIHISPEVSGLIQRVWVGENQRIDAGDPLFTLNQAPFVTAIAGIEAELDSIRIDIETRRAAWRQKNEELKLAEENLAYLGREYQRQANLAKKGMNAENQLDRALHDQQQARQAVAVIGEDLKRLLAGLQGSLDLPVTEHPNYQATLARLNQARLDLANTRITSPIAGVASKVPNPGEYAEAGQPLMTVVGTGRHWVEANYMETDLTKVVPGMPATIEVDTYPGKVWQGVVESISPATGSEFAILPPQNATGNWVKITQRIPVRISLDWRPGDPELRKGMTAAVAIDTGSYR